jgi:DNA-binding transcriptional ArsR family regulator
MADLLPSSPDPSAGDGGEPKVVGVDSDDAEDLLAALQSETARNILAALYDDPSTPSELAESADTSIQNVRYHLERLSDADIVTDADTL